MIELYALTEAHVGKRVIYKKGERTEEGTIVSWTQQYIFVKFAGPGIEEACLPEDLTFALGTPISELSGRPGRSEYEDFKRIASSWGYD